MELLNGKIKPIYFKYLSASFGTALIASVYSIVDVAMVGQYQGPEGTAALGGGSTAVEHYLQPGPAGGHRRQRAVQRPGVAAAAGTAAKTSILPQRPSAR